MVDRDETRYIGIIFSNVASSLYFGRDNILLIFSIVECIQEASPESSGA